MRDSAESHLATTMPNNAETIFTPHVTQSTLVEALLAAPPERAFVTMWNSEDDVRSVTFGQFIELARGATQQFREHDLRRGDTVILIMPQGIDLMAAFVGAMMIGAVPAILAYPNFKVDPSKYRTGLAGVSKNLSARLIMLDQV